jgi:hypothetical protein
MLPHVLAALHQARETPPLTAFVIKIIMIMAHQYVSVI